LTIRLIVFDIDGVISLGEAAALDLGLLGRLAGMNRLARTDSTRPAVTLCTGRPASYVELMLQAIDGHLPGIFENGAGLYVPENYQFLPHPRLPHGIDMKAVRHALEAGLVQTGRAYFQPGKEYTLTLFAHDPAKTDHLIDWATAALGPLGKMVDLVSSVSCINVLPRGVDKGRGLEFLAEQTGFRLAEMLGVGDSEVDLPFLDRVGYSAAPANAVPAVKRMVHYVAPRPAVDGVHDILDHFGLS
jgi:hydroxymethylpyrimidine pyrophosphatase-like HAD family hydrolase